MEGPRRSSRCPVQRRRATATARLTAGTAVALSVILALAILACSRPATFDDAMIVLVYARHLLGGGGIYWNDGDGHVDGFTSFLDLLVKTAAVALGPDDPVRGMHIASICFFLTAAVLGSVIAFQSATDGEETETRSRWRLVLRWTAPVVGALAFGANVPFAYGSSFLLETSLYGATSLAALCLLLFAPLERPTWRGILGASWVALALTRPEGTGLAVIEAALFLKMQHRRLPPRAIAVPCALLACALLAYYGWHLAYFGWLAPNTYYAKTSDSRWQEVKDGFAYVCHYARTARGPSSVLVAILPLAAFLRPAWSDARARERCGTAGLLGLVALAGVVLSGGDGYPGGRFLGVPLLYFLAAAAIAANQLRPAWKPLAFVPLLFFVYGGLGFVARRAASVPPTLAVWPISQHLFYCEAEAAAVLRRHVSSIGETDWQRVKLFEDSLRVVDLMGLNDRKTAHSPWPQQDLWGKFSLPELIDRDIDALVLGPWMDHRAPMSRYRTADIVGNDAVSRTELGIVLPPNVRPPLAERYVPLTIRVCGGVYFNLFVRRTLALSFAGENVLVGQPFQR